MKQKLLYESPSAELLVVRFEGNVMSPGVQIADMSRGGYVDEDEIELM